MTVFRTEQIPLPAARNPLDAWDIDAIAAEYDGFVEQWRPVLRQTTSGSLHGAEAVWARTQIMDSYRRFVALDPWLPSRLMPPGWARAAARETFATVYDGLAGPALEHVHQVIRSHTADPLARIRTEIRTHTVADLHDGLRQPQPSAEPGGPGPEH
jgi:phenylacetic acid degradation operon negative regulatory protein